MNPERYDELLSAYLDRELSPDERPAVDRLLQNSESARERLRELEQTSKFLRGLPAHSLESEFAGSVIDRLRHEGLIRAEPVPARRRRLVVPWWVGGPVAAAASILLALWVTRDVPPPVAAPEPLAKPGPPMTPPLIAADYTPMTESAPQIEGGDIFPILDPQGVQQLSLLVLDRPSALKTITGILIEQNIVMDRAGLPTEAEPEQDNTASKQTIIAIEADEEQIDRLLKVVQQAAQNRSSAIVDLALVDPETSLVDGLNRQIESQNLALLKMRDHTAAAAAPLAAAPQFDSSEFAKTESRAAPHADITLGRDARSVKDTPEGELGPASRKANPAATSMASKETGSEPVWLPTPLAAFGLPLAIPQTMSPIQDAYIVADSSHETKSKGDPIAGEVRGRFRIFAAQPAPTNTERNAVKDISKLRPDDRLGKRHDQHARERVQFLLIISEPAAPNQN